PSARAPVLCGHPPRRDRLVPIEHLAHLAPAADTSSPTFSLEWTPASWQRFADARADTAAPVPWDANGRINALGAWLFGEVGIKVGVGDDASEVLAKPVA